MTRNMDHRVEVASPVYNPKLQKELKKIIDLQWKDNVKARVIDEKQNNFYNKNKTRKKINSQLEIYRKISSHQLK